MYTKDFPITFKGRRYNGIKEIGFTDDGFAFLVRLFPCSELNGQRGLFSTSLPISPKEYRKKYPTQTAFYRKNRELVVLDDWGTGYSFKARKEVLDAIEKDCRKNELPSIGEKS